MFRLKSVLLVILMVINLYPLVAENLDWFLAERAGGSGAGLAYDIAVDESGNSYVTGYFDQTATFGDFVLVNDGNYYDIFVAKIDSEGNWLWARRAGSDGRDEGFGIAIDDAGNCYVTGYFSNTATFGEIDLVSLGSRDIFVTKLDSEGNWLWARNAGGGTTARGNGIAVCDEGNVYLTGEFSGTTFFGSIELEPVRHSGDIFVAKLDESGSWQWAKGAGSETSNINSGFAISVDAEGNSYVTGYFQDTVEFGATSLHSEDAISLFVAKLDSYGSWQWALQAEAAQRSAGNSIATDTEGNSYVTGSYTGRTEFGEFLKWGRGEFDLFVAKITTEGEWEWVQIARSLGNITGRSIAIDSDGNSYVTGSFSGEASFQDMEMTARGIEILVAKANQEGEWEWIDQAGGPDWDIGHGIGIDSDNNCYVTGYFQRIAWFGDLRLDAQGWNDIFVAGIGLAQTNIESEAKQLPQTDNGFILHRNYPNPFNPETLIKYEILTENEEVTLTIHNAKGQLIRTLIPPTFHTQGDYEVVWIGKDERGVVVNSGIYFYRLETSSSAQTNKMLLLK